MKQVKDLTELGLGEGIAGPCFDCCLIDRKRLLDSIQGKQRASEIYEGCICFGVLLQGLAKVLLSLLVLPGLISNGTELIPCLFGLLLM